MQLQVTILQQNTEVSKQIKYQITNWEFLLASRAPQNVPFAMCIMTMISYTKHQGMMAAVTALPKTARNRRNSLL